MATSGNERRTLPLSGRQGGLGGEAESLWWPVHSRGLFGGLKATQTRSGDFMSMYSVHFQTSLSNLDLDTACLLALIL